MKQILFLASLFASLFAVLIFFILNTEEVNSDRGKETLKQVQGDKKYSVLKIGLTLGITGKYSEISDQQMKGLRLWQIDVNKKGGILGKKIEVIIYDDKSEVDVSKRLYEHLIMKDKVDFILGPYSSTITEAVAPIAEKYRYPMLVSGASADSLWEKGYKYLFGIYSPASRYAVGFLEMLVLEDIDGIAIVGADDSFSENIASGTMRWAEMLGLRVVSVERFKKGTERLDHIVRKIMESGANVLIVCGHLEESINMRLALDRTGWRPKAYFASVGPAVDAFYEQLKGKADLTFSASQWEPSDVNPDSIAFYNSFKDTYGIKPSYHAAVAYAAGQILEIAIKKANSVEKEKIRNTLALIDTVTILGRYKVNSKGLQIRHQNLIIQWQNGKRKILWPYSLKNAEPIFLKK